MQITERYYNTSGRKIGWRLSWVVFFRARGIVRMPWLTPLTLKPGLCWNTGEENPVNCQFSEVGGTVWVPVWQWNTGSASSFWWDLQGKFAHLIPTCFVNLVKTFDYCLQDMSWRTTCTPIAVQLVSKDSQTLLWLLLCL